MFNVDLDLDSWQMPWVNVGTHSGGGDGGGTTVPARPPAPGLNESRESSPRDRMRDGSTGARGEHVGGGRSARARRHRPARTPEARELAVPTMASLPAVADMDVDWLQ